MEKWSTSATSIQNRIRLSYMPMPINHAKNLNNCEVGEDSGLQMRTSKGGGNKRRKWQMQTLPQHIPVDWRKDTRTRTRNYWVCALKRRNWVSFPCEVIKYKAQKLSKSHVKWHQFHATMGLHKCDVDKQVSSLLKNALLETATRFCGEVCSFSGASH